MLLLRPAGSLPEPMPVGPREYFSVAHLDRSEAFRSGQRWLFAGRLVLEGGVLVLLALRAPRLLRGRPVLAGAAAGAAISIALAVVTLPVSAVSRQRAVDVGLVTQSWAGWAADVLRSQAIGAGLGAAGGALLVFGMRRFGRRWWIPGAAVVVAFGAFTTYAWPVVLDPLFNRFEPLTPGPVRSEVVRLADRAGIDVAEVFVMDASRRTTAANAYVAGLGATKRVVLYDTLLEGFPPDEVRLVVAHELGHQFYSDLPRSLLFLAVVTPCGLFAAHLLVRRTAPQGGVAALPALALALVVLVPAVTWVSNQLSRQVEARADTFALQLTDAAPSFVDFERRITLRNVSDPDPPDWRTFLFSSHPPAVERIGMAEAWARGRRPSRPPVSSSTGRQVGRRVAFSA